MAIGRYYWGSRRKNHTTAVMLIIFGVVLLRVVLAFGFWQSNQLIGKTFTQSIDWLVQKVLQDPRSLLLASLPALAWQDTPEEMENLRPALVCWLAGSAGLANYPVGILQAQIPMLAQINPAETEIRAGDSVKPEQANLSPEQTTGREALVGIYNTHTGETYLLTDGRDRLTGGRGGVVTVAKAVQKTLEEQYGIPVVLSDRIHDARYATSYLESKKTAQEIVENHPHLIALLDIHRDAGRSRQDSLVEVKGKKVAPILIIVGSDARAEFPDWQQNYRFACRLADQINHLYPGLCLGVRVKEGRYNQFLHPGALLLEIGTDNNSLTEALASGEMLAHALAQLVRQEVKARQILPPEGGPPAEAPAPAADRTVEQVTGASKQI
ncbi:stage II sporulation protein P [Desulforamulus hydrothermalis]|uniref:Stage II sporulation protein P n=1 Tax=Desulforamulus hydrothermalis Lam5 = DSM 18033 TaxID=1121428 RepID=K8DYG6_9FIRM|nr:stage II sporulation protein P [Desulforamulus hydrothermalis]CCO07892.1 Stage II sporulation protein P [Desulforamulus hydrothermalis Lam5 = DSM 18033]SHH35188.1 stage II sporulation protein P [Desulforamulus hydrothermalis Lam5 = DSM 18033]